jgi:chorismate dehydratase
MLRIGEIQYANVYPIFYYLKKVPSQDFKFVRGVPSYLNKMLMEGCLDTSALSSITYARFQEHSLIIPEISISSIGKVKSVMLFSNLSKDKLKGAKVYLTDESGTSVILLKIIFKKFWDMDVVFVNEESNADAFLYIGDKALLSYYGNDFSFKYDLGEEWYNYTGYPFVYALWLLNKDKADEAWFFVKTLLDIKSKSKNNLSALIDEYILKGLTTYQILDYWETIDYNLSDKHIKGLLLYYQYAKELGAIKEVPPLNFYI